MLASLLLLASLSTDLPVRRVVLDDDFPGAYQVEVADINGDGRQDVVALGGSTCAWYENPTWTKRVLTGADQTPGVISSAAADLDGDGRAEVAIAYDFEMTQPRRGKLGLARQGRGPDDPWTFEPIADVPSIHRLRWWRAPQPHQRLTADSGPLSLVVAPIFGPEDVAPDFGRHAAEILLFSPAESGPWTRSALARRPVIHAIDVNDWNRDGASDFLLTADNLGVGALPPLARRPSSDALGPDGLIDLFPGVEDQPPRRGASEIHRGFLAGPSPSSYYATIEPWHGTRVVVHPLGPGEPLVIDSTLDDGHALWVADLDADGSDEILAGHRGRDHRVAVYRHDDHGWHRTVLDPGVAAQDLRGGDLDGDGRADDVVTVGGSTHNVVAYFFGP